MLIQILSSVSNFKINISIVSMKSTHLYYIKTNSIKIILMQDISINKKWNDKIIIILYGFSEICNIYMICKYLLLEIGKLFNFNLQSLCDIFMVNHSNMASNLVNSETFTPLTTHSLHTQFKFLQKFVTITFLKELSKTEEYSRIKLSSLKNVITIKHNVTM